jgi:hypothetical protein
MVTIDSLPSNPSVRDRRNAWVGLLLPPTIVLVSMQVNYMLVDWACINNARGVLYFSELPFVLISIWGTLLANGLRQRAKQRLQNKLVQSQDRMSFMALMGTLIGLLATLTILLQWIANIVIDPCMQ